MPPRHNFSAVCLAAAACVAFAAPAPDDPYEEIVAVRRPLNSSWPAPSRIPTGWSTLPCTSFFNGDTRVPQAAPSSLGPLFMCAAVGGGGNVTLFDARGAGVAHTLPATVLPPSALGSGVLAAAPGMPFVILLLPNSATIYVITCIDSEVQCSVTPLPGLSPVLPDSIHATVVYPSTGRGPGWWTLWLTGEGFIPGVLAATMAYDVSATGVVTIASHSWGGVAIAHSVLLREVSVGNSTKMSHIDTAAPGTIRRWEWATDVDTGLGGPYDGPITALAYDDDAGGVLYVGTPVCLNVRQPNGAIFRLAAREGLPWGNITSLTLDSASSPSGGGGGGGWTRARLWIGTNRGVILFDPTAPTSYGRVVDHAMTAAAATLPVSVGRGRQLLPTDSGAVTSAPLRQRWRYFYGARYLATRSNDSFVGDVTAGGLVSMGNATYVVTSAGLSVLESQQWTLAAKVAVVSAVEAAAVWLE